jgi:hypothetical protein
MKLPLFQEMVDLNRSFDQVAAGLQRLQAAPFFQRDLIRHALSDIEIARVYANWEFFDNFEKIVEDDARWAYRFQRKFDQKLKDRDDIYLEIKASEERRKGKGLAPRIVILPDWDMSDEDRYDEEHTKRRSRMRPKKSRRHSQPREARR